MAESKGALIAKSVQKHAGRAKEKLLQNLGKVDRTLDDIFEEHLQNYNRQHQQAIRLQKEFNNYIRCIRAAQTASKSLMEAITEVYESSWAGHDLLYVQAQNMEMLWQDFSHKLGDQVLIPLNTYSNQFPETRKKIEKRGRKLVDYDSQRHSFQNLQANAAKRRDDVKITKGREQLEEAKRTYEVLNSELHDELPALYDSRVLFYVNNLQTLFSAEQLFHSETSKVYAELEAITDKLANECQRAPYKKPASPIGQLNGTATVQITNGNNSPTNSDTELDEKKPLDIEKESPEIEKKSPEFEKMAPEIEKKQPEEAKKENGVKKEEFVKENGHDEIEIQDKKVEELYDIPVATLGTGSPVPPEKSGKENKEKNSEENGKKEKEEKKDNGDAKSDDVYDIPVGATLAGLPAGVLYRVRATYRYTREDADELSFDIGDVIRVIEYDDPDDQEEGWLMGLKENTNEKGMFPANFTRPI